MKIIYESIYNGIMRAINAADRQGRRINSIELTPKEFSELTVEHTSRFCDLGAQPCTFHGIPVVVKV